MRYMDVYFVLGNVYFMYMMSNDEVRFNKFPSNNYDPISISVCISWYVKLRMYHSLSLITHEQFMYVKIKRTM